MWTRIFALMLALALFSPAFCEGRLWKAADGKHSIEADLVDFDQTNCVLKKKDGKLVFVKIDQLSKADQEYLKSKEAVTIHEEAPEAYRTWTLKDGREIVGQIKNYAKKTIQFTRKDGNVFVNNKRFDDLKDWQKYVAEGIASHDSQTDIDSKEKMGSWLARHRPPQIDIPCEGVILQLKDKSIFAAPFYMFTSTDQQYLQNGWDKWQEAYAAKTTGDNTKQADNTQKKSNEELQSQLDELKLQLRSRSRLEARERALSMKANQIYIEEAFGNAMWRVNLMPKPGVRLPPRQVVVPGRDSLQAMYVAERRYPQYNIGGVSKVGNQRLGYFY